jgi:integrase/recombinase XerD
VITVFVKHSAGCKSKDKYYKRCNCRKWLYNPEWRPDPRRSAKTRSWERAEKLARKLESGESAGVTMGEAVTQFLADKRNQNVSKSWIRKFEVMLEGWIPERRLDSLTLRDLEEFRNSWTGAAITRRKRQERLRSFFHYCVKHKWMGYNLAADLSRIRVDSVPTDYFTPQELESLLSVMSEKLRALTLLMRHSGLRIADAVAIEKERIGKSALMLYTQKTGTPVFVPLPDFVIGEISNNHPFHNGHRKLKSTVTYYQEQFQKEAKKAGITKRAHPHMLRDTFAVELLLAGVPIEQVSILLGHSSVKITEKHYSPWVAARQQQLEESVRKSWQHE